MPLSHKPRHVRVIISSAAISRKTVGGNEITAIRGSLPPEYFDAPFIPPYQREQMDGHKRYSIMTALDPKGKGIPDDIILSLRHGSFEAVGANEIAVTGPLAIVDGLQRLTGGLFRVEDLRKSSQSLGVVIYVGLSPEDEEEIFQQVNREQTKVSTDVHLKNRNSPPIKALRDLAETDENFALYRKVKWGQLRKPTMLITSRILYETAAALYGVAPGKDTEQLIEALEVVAARVGLDNLVETTKSFFDLIEEFYADEEDRRFVYTRGFLLGMASFLSRFENFWNKKRPYRLHVNVTDKKKILKFPLRAAREVLKSKNPVNAMHVAILSHVMAGGRSADSMRVRGHIPGS